MKSTPAIITILVLVIIGIGIYFFTYNTSGDVSPVGTTQTETEGTTDTSVTPTPAPDIPTTPTLITSTVEIKNFAFSPSTLNIKTGTKVTWTNNDSAPHTVTSVSGNLLKSATLTTGQSFSYVFTNPGTVNYYCTVHPNMKGTVVVSN